MKWFKTLKSWFGQMDMSWKLVIEAALISGLTAGIVNCIPFLKDTSFDDIAHNLEVWVVLGLWIVSNTKSSREAALKVFVFFLISQPLIFLIESPFFGLQVFSSYPYWLLITLLTAPAGYFAWYIGRESWKGAVALFFAEAILIAEGCQYMWIVINQFPRQLLAMIFCFGSVLLLPLVFYTQKKRRFLLLAAEIPILLFFLSISSLTQDYKRIVGTYQIPQAGMGLEAAAWEAETDQEELYHISGIEGSYIRISALNSAPVPATITCTSSDGRVSSFRVEVAGHKLYFTPLDPYGLS